MYVYYMSLFSAKWDQTIWRSPHISTKGYILGGYLTSFQIKTKFADKHVWIFAHTHKLICRVNAKILLGHQVSILNFDELPY